MNEPAGSGIAHKNETKPLAKSKAKRKAKFKPAPSPANDNADADSKKVANAVVAWAEKLRKEMSQAVHSSTELLSLINSHEEYKWARTDANLEGLRTSRAELDTLKNSNGFWKEWSVQGFWSKWVRSNYADSAIIKEVNSAKDKFGNAVNKVNREKHRIQETHQRSTSGEPAKKAKSGL